MCKLKEGNKNNTFFLLEIFYALSYYKKLLVDLQYMYVNMYEFIFDRVESSNSILNIMCSKFESSQSSFKCGVLTNDIPR